VKLEGDLKNPSDHVFDHCFRSAGKIPQQIATFRNHCFASDERRFQITNYIGTRLVELLTPIEQRNNHASVE